MKIGLISDSHGYFGNDVIDHLVACDEIWHAGDIGGVEVLDQIGEVDIPYRAVYGNIDDKTVRLMCPRDLQFDLEGISVFMTHIGGYPPKYNARVRSILENGRPNLYVCGHSHILKIIPDRALDLLHMNPGAIGHKGLHHMRTLITFEIENAKIFNVAVVELGRRGRK